MSVDEIKRGIASLSPNQQSEISAFLFRLRHASDPEYQERVNSRLADHDSSNWLTPEAFERQFEQA